MHGWGTVVAVLAAGIAALALVTAYAGRFHPVFVAATVVVLVVLFATSAIALLFGGLFVEIGLIAGACAAVPAIIGASAGQLLRASRESN